MPRVYRDNLGSDGYTFGGGLYLGGLWLSDTTHNSALQKSLISVIVYQNNAFYTLY